MAKKPTKKVRLRTKPLAKRVKLKPVPKFLKKRRSTGRAPFPLSQPRAVAPAVAPSDMPVSDVKSGAERTSWKQRVRQG